MGRGTAETENAVRLLERSKREDANCKMGEVVKPSRRTGGQTVTTLSGQNAPNQCHHSAEQQEPVMGEAATESIGLTSKGLAEDDGLLSLVLRSVTSFVYGDPVEANTEPSPTGPWSLPDGKAYVPGAGCVMVIAAGAPWVWDNSVQGTPRRSQPPPAHWSVHTLANAGYDMTVVWDKAYDKNPPNWRNGSPLDLTCHQGKNNSTVADDLALPKIYELVAEGRGPAVVLTGSRGGMFTLPRLWELGWRGAAICVNAGCTFVGKVPRGCRLTLVTGGQDFFDQSKDPSVLPKLLMREEPHDPVFVYHDPRMGHTGAPDDFEKHGHHVLTTRVLERLVKIMEIGYDNEESSWPSGAYLYQV